MLQRILLKPYGDELLTRGADFWLFCARLLIFAMALAEALAWGYMGALMSAEHPIVAASIAGVFVFTLIWIIDATFMTLDLSRGGLVKTAAGVTARVLIVASSLFITAPFLAQAIFSGDVRDEMTRRNATVIAAKRAEIERPFAARLDALRRDKTTLEQQRVNEVAGTGLSGKYGRGPAFETIDRQLSETRREIESVETSRASALARFDGMSRPQLAENYGVRFLSEGVQSSGALLAEMLETREFNGAELAVRAFLAFLFLGLLILKIFQPRSVSVYFNEQLHSFHDQYRKGLFDRFLPEPERSTSGAAIDALRFEDWSAHACVLIREEEKRRVGEMVGKE